MTFVGSVDELRERLMVTLKTFGASIAERVPGTQWRAEMPSSHVYDLVALLTFSSSLDPDTELVVVSLESRNLQEGSWTLDVTDRESMPLTDGVTLLDGTRPMATSTLDAAMAEIQAVLGSWGDRIVGELSP
jgi:hypothetical protein